MVSDHLGFAALASLTDLTVLVGLASITSVVGLKNLNDLRDLNPQAPQDSLQLKNMKAGYWVQCPALDHSGHFSYSSTQP